MMKQGEVNFRLSGLRELPQESHISSRLIRICRGEEIGVALRLRVEPDVRSSLVRLKLGVCYSCVHGYLRRTLLDYHIEADFEIDRLQEHVEMSGADAVLSTRLMTMMLSVTIGSLRGMLAIRTARTWLADYPLPVINISELISRLHYGSDWNADALPLVNFIYN